MGSLVPDCKICKRLEYTCPWCEWADAMWLKTEISKELFLEFLKDFNTNNVWAGQDRKEYFAKIYAALSKGSGL